MPGAEPEQQDDAGADEAADAEHQERPERVDVVASQPKFIPKNPVMNVSGRKIVAISVSRLAVSFWRTLISFCSTEITAMFACSTIASRSRWATTSSLTSFRWSLTSR